MEIERVSILPKPYGRDDFSFGNEKSRSWVAKAVANEHDEYYFISVWDLLYRHTKTHTHAYTPRSGQSSSNEIRCVNV